jgi:uncharacterized protein
VADYYLVERAKGPAWDHTRGRREQAGWDEHAAFMDALAGEGFVVLGGPIGEGDGENVLLVVAADGEATIRARLAEDPWPDELLRIESIRPWSVLLRASPGCLALGAAQIIDVVTDAEQVAPQQSQQSSRRRPHPDQDPCSLASSDGSGTSNGPSFGVPIRSALPNGSRSPQSVP